MEHQREDEVIAKIIEFVENLVVISEKYISEYMSRLDNQTGKPGKVADFLNKILNTGQNDIEEVVGSNAIFSLFGGAISAGGIYYNGKKLRQLVRRLYYFKNHPEKVREELVESAIKIFANFECQFVQVEAYESWERAMVKLADCAVARIIYYFRKNKAEISVELITKGVILGKSKRYKHTCTGFSHLNRGHTLKNVENVKWNTSELFKKTGILADNKYYKKSKYGYRLPFIWEQYYGDEVKEKDYPKEKYAYIIKQDENLQKELKIKLLNKINKQELKLPEEIPLDEIKLDAEKNADQLIKTLTNIDSKTEERRGKENHMKKKILFQLKEPSQWFIGREERLQEIYDNIWKGIICISGLAGVGKSELAVKYAYNHREDYDYIVFIDAQTQNTLEKSFRTLAKDYLELRLKNSDGEEKRIQSIIHDVYDEISTRKSLLIFDNVQQQYPIFQQFLPLCLPPGNTKPHFIITSNNFEPKQNVRNITLGDFTEAEAKEFVRNILDDDSQDDDISELIIKLHKFPLALQQAAKFIKHNDNTYKKRSRTFKVRDYIVIYEETPEKLLDPKIDLDEQTKTVYKTLIVMVNTIKSENVKSLQMLNIISYFASSNIPEKIFLKELASNDESELQTITSLLETYSIVRLDEGMLSVHGLVQLVIRLELDKHEEEKRKTLETALRLLKEHMEDRDSAESFTPHIISIWNEAIKYDELIKEYIVNDNMEKYTTYFHLISGSSSYEVVESVVRKIAENYPDELDKVINAENQERGVPLHNAALIGDEPIIKLLLEKGANVNARKNHGWTPLLLAAKNGHTNATKSLLNDPRVEINAKTNHSNTALHFAANSKNAEIVQLLINGKANINAVTEDKYTPLHLASKNGNVKIVKILLSADPEAKHARTKSNFTPLHFAACDGHLNVVKVLLDENADVNAETEDQFTPLHFAAMKGHLKVVNALLNKNANVKVKTTRGKTPSDLAKKQEIIQQLKLKEISS